MLGLFEKAIVSGPTHFTPGAFHYNQVDIGVLVAHSLGYEGTDMQEMAEFLCRQPAIALQKAAKEQEKIVTKVTIL